MCGKGSKRSSRVSDKIRYEVGGRRSPLQYEGTAVGRKLCLRHSIGFERLLDQQGTQKKMIVTEWEAEYGSGAEITR